ncbi:peroxidase family protein [Sphingomonas sp. 37zxx]|uniref:peroxidase family protein n=1 Tax=Sphingomonas sp. 37zxx TaxID=1550073 RepID=UPI00068A7D35|nr:peroxidase family protein [Sphingomonas sp. 37zxx]
MLEAPARTSGRDTSADGLWIRLRAWALQHMAPLWRAIAAVPPLQRLLNRALINAAATVGPPRPHPFATVSDYTSWRSLTDRSFYARHLPTADPPPDIPTAAQAVALFRRAEGGMRECPKSTLLFPVFAQYLTDGFLRTDMADRQRTTSNHDIDLSPLYGRTWAQTQVLRTRDESPGRRGRLDSQELAGEEYPPFLFEADGKTLRGRYLDAEGRPILDPPLGLKPGDDGAARQIFAVGGDRANATPLVAMLNTLLLREHNRLAAGIEAENQCWDDERIFQTARNCLIVIYIRIVIEEYINHISSAIPRLAADPSAAWTASWNRPNWMTVEFALLYRWHSMIPESIGWEGRAVPADAMLLDNTWLTRVGMARALVWAAEQRVGALGLFNTPQFLLDVEARAIAQGQANRVARYNDYRAAMGMPRVRRFEQMTADPERLRALREIYGSPDRLDFYVGLFAEDVSSNTPMPPLIGRMVALDAFTQALTNPLMSRQVFNVRTFGAWGFAEVGQPQSIAALLQRQRQRTTLPPGASVEAIRMTRPDWVRV